MRLPNQRSKIRAPCLLPPVPVGDRVAEDAEEQRRPLIYRPVPVRPDQLQHGVLHDVERCVMIAGADARHPEGPAFNTSQKAVERVSGTQRDMALAWTVRNANPQATVCCCHIFLKNGRAAGWLTHDGHDQETSAPQLRGGGIPVDLADDPAAAVAEAWAGRLRPAGCLGGHRRLRALYRRLPGSATHRGAGRTWRLLAESDPLAAGCRWLGTDDPLATGVFLCCPPG
jgi:hypothetical protein